MKLTVLLVCVSLQLAYSSAEERERETNCDQGNENDKAGGYILTQQNVAGFCLTQQLHGERPCEEQPSDIWLIHGLWPTLDSNGQNGICFCRNESFVVSNVQDIPNIDKYWRDLFQPANPEVFWQHEWGTHGTCAITSAGPMPQRQYFTQTLDLYVKYNFTDILQRNDIVPSNTTPYKMQDFLIAFKNELNVIPAMTLTSNKKMVYIYAMQLCMDNNFMLSDCTTDWNSQHGQVYYLENTHTTNK